MSDLRLLAEASDAMADLFSIYGEGIVTKIFSDPSAADDFRRIDPQILRAHYLGVKIPPPEFVEATGLASWAESSDDCEFEHLARPFVCDECEAIGKTPRFKTKNNYYYMPDITMGSSIWLLTVLSPTNAPFALLCWRVNFQPLNTLTMLSNLAPARWIALPFSSTKTLPGIWRKELCVLFVISTLHLFCFTTHMPVAICLLKFGTTR